MGEAWHTWRLIAAVWRLAPQDEVEDWMGDANEVGATDFNSWM